MSALAEALLAAHREWGFYYAASGRGHDWIRLNIGPGVIPF